MPSNVFGPASVERPLIIAATDECEISKLPRKYNFGLVIEPENVNSLVYAVIKLKEDKRLAKLIGENGRLFMVKERKIENVIDKFEEEILNVKKE